jgi:hypothetical protein
VKFRCMKPPEPGQQTCMEHSSSGVVVRAGKCKMQSCERDELDNGLCDVHRMMFLGVSPLKGEEEDS